MESSQRGSDVYVWITKWVGQAWQEFVESETIQKYFLRTGCLLPVDGSPNKIRLQGLRGYTFGPKQDRRFIIDVDSEDEEDSSSDEDEDNRREELSEGYSTEEESSPDDHKEEDDGDDVAVSNGRTTEQQRWAIKDNERVSIKMCGDGPIVATGKVELQMKSVHNHAIPENSVVVVVREVFEGADFGVDPFGEPNARPGAFIAVERSNLVQLME